MSRSTKIWLVVFIIAWFTYSSFIAPFLDSKARSMMIEQNETPMVKEARQRLEETGAHLQRAAAAQH